MSCKLGAVPALLLSWILINLAPYQDAPIADAVRIDVPNTFEREIDGLAALARKQRSANDNLFQFDEQKQASGPKCFQKEKPAVAVFRRFNALLDLAERTDGDCQEFYEELIADKTEGKDISTRTTHQACLKRCSDTSENKKSCETFLPKKDKYYHKLVVENKRTAKRFGVCVRVRSFDGDESHLGLFETKRECKRSCSLLTQDSSPAQQSRSLPSLSKRASCLYPCMNGGSCINGKCVCAVGFTGNTCEERLCDPPCQNSGTCNNGTCICTKQYTGKSCEHAICDIPCANGGTCNDPDRNICTCPPGYYGSRCQFASCVPFCQNGGTCSSPNTCKCPFAYTGNLCQTPKGAFNPEYRGVAMFNSTSMEFYEQCFPGYSGTNCSIAKVCEMTSQKGISKQIAKLILDTAKVNIHALDWSGNNASDHTCLAYLNSVVNECTTRTTLLSQHQCEEYCLPSHTGSVCRRIFDPVAMGYNSSIYTSPRWYHDNSDMTCKPFSYLGCAGNGNNFFSQADCISHCITPPTTPAPQLPVIHPASPEVPGLCYISGRGHFTTFDHQEYSFYGTCSYKALIDNSNVKQIFQVVLNNDKNCDINAPCTKSVDVNVDGKKVHLGQEVASRHGFVKVDGVTENLPYTKSWPNIRQAGKYVIVRTSDEVLIYFDGSEELMIKVPDSYKTVNSSDTRLKGLCGNYDGNNTNDFIGLDGTTYTKDNINDFGVSMLDDPLCTNPPKPPSGCYSEVAGDVFSAMQNAEKMCSVIQSDAFSACRSKVDFRDFKAQCIADVCACNSTSRSDCMCNVLSTYSKACAWNHNITLSWRSPSLCPVTCPSGMEHSECNSACPRDCSNMNSDPNACNSKCVDGCFCPEGKIQDRGKCVDPGQCSCYHSGIPYAHGAIRKTECSSCLCNGGMWNCTDTPCSGTCTMVGNSHFTTFDSRSYSMHGQCDYVLSEHCHFSNDTTKQFTIHIKISSDGSRQLIVSLAGATPVTLGGVEGSPTVLNSNGKATSHILSVEHIGVQNVLVHAYAGLTILWTGYNAYITVGPDFKSQTCGLCGTFNQNDADDFHTRDGDNEADAYAFAQEWQVVSSVAASNCHRSNWNQLDQPCSTYSSNEGYAKSGCNAIIDLNGPFKACHRYVPPQDMYQKCVKDGCMCKDCLCSVAAAYAKACADKGIVIDGWRDTISVCKPKFVCPAGTVLKQCNRDPLTRKLRCPSTCDDLANVTDTCPSRRCVEGCYCEKEGELMNNEHKCVDKTQCPCYFGDTMYKYGEIRKDRCNNCTCKGGVFDCTNVDCEAMCLTRGLVYSDCGITCENLHPINGGERPCVSGCYCPDGLIMHDNGTCVQSMQCQCKHNNKYYDAGAISPTDCSRKCRGDRYWEQLAGIQAQPEYECSAFGKGHYRTFDGMLYNFESEGCGYTFMEHEDVKVVVKNMKCVNSFELQMCKEVTITLVKENVEVVMMQKSFTLKRNGIDTAYNPGSYPPPCKPFLNTYMNTLEIFQVGLFMIVRIVDRVNPNHIKFEIRFDQGTRVYVMANTDYKGTVQGLCGNFDGKDSNDKRTSTGSIATSIPEFADSWRVGSACLDTKTVSPCVLYPDRKPWADKGCEEIRANPNFTICHDAVNPAPYIEACKYETCMSHMGGDCGAFCSAIAAYVRACNRYGISILWRREGFCELPCCRPCANSGGYIADNKLPYSCLQKPKNCDEVGNRCCRGARVEGCSCPPNEFFNGIKCVPLNETCNDTCASSIYIPSSTPTTSIPTTTSVPTTKISTPTTSVSTPTTKVSTPTTTSVSTPTTKVSTPTTKVSTPVTTSVSTPTTKVSTPVTTSVSTPTTKVSTPTTKLSTPVTTSVSTPTTKVSTPTTKVSTPVTTSVSTPTTKVSTPTTKVSTPVTTSVSTPTTKVSTPTTKVSTPVTTSVSTPTTKVSTPTTKVSTPTTKVSTPTTKVSTPVTTSVSTPTTKVSTPTTKASTPVTTSVSTPTTKVSTPVTTSVSTPTTKVSTPTTKVSTPVTTSVSTPTTKVSTPTTKVSTPTTKVSTPVTTTVSTPTTKVSTPTTKVSTPTTKVSTPVTTSVSTPTTKVSTPTTKVSTPVTTSVSTPTTKVSTPVTTSVSTPTTKVSTPVTTSVSTPTTKVSTPTTKVSTPTTKVSTPVTTSVSTPTTKVSTPTTKLSTPTTKVSTPTTKVSTPVTTSVSTPTTKVSTPTSKVSTPTTKVSTPVTTSVSTPTTKVSTPTTKVSTPVTTSVSTPTTKVSTPTTKVSTPTTKVSTPVTTSVSTPTTKVSTPTTKVSTPTTKVSTPVTTSVSTPTTKVSTPTTKVSTPVTTSVSTPTTKVSTPVTTSVSTPTTKVSTPTTKVSTPVTTSVSTPTTKVSTPTTKVSTPTTKVSTPVTTSVSTPTTKVSTPTTKVSTPTTKVSTPVTTSVSTPTTKVSTPTTKVSTPTTKVSTPVTTSVSTPTTKVSTPTTKVSTPVTTSVSTPTTKVSTPVTTSVSTPTTKVSTPTTKVSTPTTKVSTPVTTSVSTPTTKVSTPTTKVSTPTTKVSTPTTKVSTPVTTSVSTPTTKVSTPVTTSVSTPTTKVSTPTTKVSTPTTIIHSIKTQTPGGSSHIQVSTAITKSKVSLPSTFISTPGLPTAHPPSTKVSTPVTTSVSTPTTKVSTPTTKVSTPVTTSVSTPTTKVSTPTTKVSTPVTTSVSTPTTKVSTPTTKVSTPVTTSVSTPTTKVSTPTTKVSTPTTKVSTPVTTSVSTPTTKVSTPTTKVSTPTTKVSTPVTTSVTTPTTKVSTPTTKVSTPTTKVSTPVTTSVSTPTTKVSTPTTKVSTPTTKVSTPVTTSVSTPTTKVSTPTTKVSTPTTKVSTPVTTSVSTPTTKVSTPTTKVSTPTTKVSTPVTTSVSTPTTKVSTPTTKVSTPTTKVSTPVTTSVTTPTTKVSTPTTKVSTPTTKVSTPVTTSVSTPTTKVSTPTTKVSTPTTKVSTPVTTSVSTPTTKVSTPTTKVSTPTTKVSTPVTTSVSTPTTKVSTPTTKVSTPTTKVSTPVTTSLSTPTTKVSTPTTKVSTPTTKVSTPVTTSVSTPTTKVSTPTTKVSTPTTKVSTPVTTSVSTPTTKISIATTVTKSSFVYVSQPSIQESFSTFIPSSLRTSILLTTTSRSIGWPSMMTRRSTPTTKVSTPVTTSVSTPTTKVSTPTTKISTPVTTSLSTPTTKVSTPTTKVSTPTTKVSTPTTKLSTPVTTSVSTPTTTLTSIPTTSVVTTSFTTTSITPSSAYTSIPTPSQSICPVCVYVNSNNVTEYYKIGDKWTDGPCKNMSCEAVSNPCYPTNTTAQIKSNSIICPACPEGYDRLNATSDVCCGECVPVIGPTTIPPKCERQEFGAKQIKIGACYSNQTYLHTGCGGYCDSSATATHGVSLTLDHKCTCCSAAKVTRFNVYMVCPDKSKNFETMFPVIDSCTCHSISCSKDITDNGLVEVSESSGEAVLKRRRRRR
ncbi:mucin-2 isoform X50 [Nematostella vectensis]|uniref:mucin-2 isoform X50 n=1 Tax=Nematostella vectensis TaxID=45351 RepID=UPI0020774473|nr:mucin-2 isoform X50 [Nematostella vectensis]